MLKIIKGIHENDIVFGFNQKINVKIAVLVTQG